VEYLKVDYDRFLKIMTSKIASGRLALLRIPGVPENQL